jgi:hypothetical protein
MKGLVEQMNEALANPAVSLQRKGWSPCKSAHLEGTSKRIAQSLAQLNG